MSAKSCGADPSSNFINTKKTRQLSRERAAWLSRRSLICDAIIQEMKSFHLTDTGHGMTEGRWIVGKCLHASKGL
jgi:hypothetical protein